MAGEVSENKNRYGIISGNEIKEIPDLWSHTFVELGMYLKSEGALKETQKQLERAIELLINIHEDNLTNKLRGEVEMFLWKGK